MLMPGTPKAINHGDGPKIRGFLNPNGATCFDRKRLSTGHLRGVKLCWWMPTMAMPKWV